MRNILMAMAAATLLVGCAGNFEAETGLAQIASQGEFAHPLYAPLHLGREVLTGANHTDPKGYMDGKFRTLLDAGLIKYEIKEKNSWRTLVELSLTDKASKLVDGDRTAKFQREQGEDDMFYVAVCSLVPQTIVGVDTLCSDTMCIRYNIEERDITPFGAFLGFQDGRTHAHKRTFARSTFGWNLLPL